MASSAQRRLAYILSDESYGPKLARLRGEDERRVLDLISQNRGKEARQSILEADKNRRERQRVRKAERQAVRRPTPVSAKSRTQKELEAVRRILTVFGTKASASRVRSNVRYMTGGELDFASDASGDDLHGRALGPADRKDSSGKDINPFWYH